MYPLRVHYFHRKRWKEANPTIQGPLTCVTLVFEHFVGKERTWLDEGVNCQGDSDIDDVGTLLRANILVSPQVGTLLILRSTKSQVPLQPWGWMSV